jgi:hypothetical protein
MVENPLILVHRVELGQKAVLKTKFGKHLYELFAVVYIQEGVYMAAVKREDQWYKFNPNKDHP